MWIFYFLFWTAVRASAEEPLYRKIGDKVVLTPDSVENPITNIRWKHGPNIAMEWNGDETISYKQFKDRGSLNISTGVMTITGLTPDLSGIYTAEINNKVNSETELHVISPVPKPSISVSCEHHMTHCVFTCSGNITGAEPVTYWWTAGGKRWNSTKELRITKEEEEQWFSCTLENPVSSNSSEKVSNPFMERCRTYILIPVVVFILVVCFIIIIIYFRHKYKKGDTAKTEQGQDAVDGTAQAQAAADLLSCHQDPKPIWQYEGKKNGEWCEYIKMTNASNKCSVNNDDTERQNQDSESVKGEPNKLDVNTPDLQSGRSPITRLILSEKKRLLSNRSEKDGDVGLSSVSSDDIEKWYQEKPHDKMPLTLDEGHYELDFNNMIQTNLTTKTKREIKRVIYRR